ncbi:MAG TPA: hypothetical protein VFH58_16855 [Acidimicrobiales bacterium]|nr:hypothetical protein [Acidimicrobiales bacterium]
MAITTTKLNQAAGIAAAVAGAIFIGVQINHPAFTTYVTDTHEWVLRCSAKAVMAVLALAGLTAIYARHVRQMKALGLVGFAVFALGYLGMFVTEMIAVTVLPGLTHSNPSFVNDVVVASGGGHAHGSIGHLQTLFNLTGACYMLGGLAFGVALFRARVLSRWASALLAVSTVATAALAVLPSGFDRPMAVPEGVALIGLGFSLWRDQRHAVETPVAPSLRPEPVAI